jgi:hypothetical protein
MLSKEGGRRTTRTRPLTGAYDLLVEEGYQATTLQGVARRAGLGTGAGHCPWTAPPATSLLTDQCEMASLLSGRPAPGAERPQP